MVMTAQAACSASASLSQCQVRSDGLIAWLEHAPDAEGKQIFCYFSQGTVVRLLSSGVSIRSTVNEYGARAWCFAGEGIIYIAEASQQLHYWSPFNGDAPQPFAGQTGARYSEPTMMDDGRVIAIEEWRGVHRLVVFDPQGTRQVLREGEDFYAGLTVGPGERVGWVSWQHPQQPWTQTSLWWARLDAHGLVDVECVRQPASAVQMPSFDAEGGLLFLDDKDGFWQLYRYEGHALQVVRQANADLANAPWQTGHLLYGVDCHQQWWTVHFEATGVTLWCNDKRCDLPAVTQIRELVVHQDQLVMIHAGPHCMAQISRFQQGQWQPLWTVPLPPDARLTEAPTHKVFQVEGQSVSGYWYAATGVNGPAPLLINLHGGPTAACYPVYNPLFQFWNDHGFSVFDLNYRGSSNQGREYRMQLEHRWGILDVEDIYASIDHLITQDLVDRDRIFIRGRSSGGYSVLMALLDSDAFCAAGVYFGVSDPARLHTHTHKFESHYLPWLLGPMDDSDPVYQARVPARRAAHIRTPVIFFQGLQDKVVTPEQTASMAAAIQAIGGHAETLYFADEGHGFRHRQNNVSALLAELAFYRAAMAGQCR